MDLPASGQRTEEQLHNHYLVEKDLAEKLLNSTREERPALFASLYDELFRRVPDHPRLTRRDDPEDSRRNVAARMRFLRDFVEPDTTFVEFAPGDCRLAFEVCRHVKRVVAIDISDQRAKGEATPENFELVVYNGYDLDLPKASADLVFSYQFLEHLHPDDFRPHLDQVLGLLKPGGVYVFSTPHALSGPHDISGYFCDHPEGLHFKEWTYGEMIATLKASGFSKAFTFRRGKVWESGLANFITVAAERCLKCLPRKISRRISRRIFANVAVVAFK